ncbi:MAG TPA: iron ABC transporter permease [Methylomusa anaerophila]|uniref:Putative ABC transporter permease protein n=1 Tax=Methylomusa anaerophila TaxID=1930071 RepID=A0A348AEG4_9FIRM|nr:iron ABC transporter permease [Methylomusa anaerophila]BBB89462.1 putative ABC transporter permease protein [Methylomusa anaerophila]HML89694.1 iron ABC transporter permease [Methylomusa anaerophila]
MSVFNATGVLVLFLFFLAAAFCLSLFIGSYGIEPLSLVQFLIHKVMPGAFPGPWPETYDSILINIRLPRLLLGMLVGASLSAAGTVFQGLFRNPLADSYTLGLSTGASFGAALALAFFPGEFNVTASAFIFGLLAVGAAYGLARQSGEVPAVALILAGVIVSALFSALIAIIQYMVDPLKLQGIVFWLMGGLNMANWQAVAVVGPLIMFTLLILSLLGWRLNILSMGDAEAKSLGLDVEKNKAVFIILVSLGVSAAVSVSGAIGWVGLMAPHIIRMAAGADHRKLLPLTAIGGAAFMLLADDLARGLFTFELPVGIVTTVLGAPFFAYLMKNRAKGGWT